ncbi:lipopolysaccharide biosynthesis protein [Sphingobacterium sp. R2]|uniref:lipopolysaccharide biosynthesis protein n=1 Tax=Sphingobacterium sp. R2 TaxID=3112958 RepID=UPI00345DACA0
MGNSLKKDLLKGSFWSVVGQFLTLIIAFITNIWLARILSPEEFGRIGIVMFFITIMSVLTESGLGGALVRNKNATITDYSTVFFTNLFFSIIIYLVVALCSYPISSYYNDGSLRVLLLVSSLVVIINSLQISQDAKLISDLKFKQKYIYKFIATIASSFIGIVMAYSDFGIWSLIVMQLLNSLIYGLCLWMCEKIFLKLIFSTESFKKVFSFGIFTTVSSLFNSFFDNVYQLILAKYFSVIQTGNYYQAKRIQDVPGGILNVLSQGVIFSSLSKLQDNSSEFLRVYNLISKVFAMILGFISLLFYLYSRDIILILFGEKWIGSIFYMQVLTLASFFYMQETFNRVVFKVFNKTKFILYCDFVKKVVQSISIIIAVYYKNLELLIFGFVISSIFGYVLNFLVSRKVIGNTGFYELKIVGKITTVCIFLCSLYLAIDNIMQFEFLIRILSIPLICLLYISSLLLMRVVSLVEIRRLLKIGNR